jgi:tRNA dimethylallyltransferase
MPATLARILAIVGPTATGKTSLALAIAEQCDAEIVSADSRQVYKYLDIGTAKPSFAERAKVKHHFVDMLEPTSLFSAGQFGREAREVISEIVKAKKLPILTGGSGLYVKAVIDGLFDGPGRDHEIRLHLEEQLRSDGLEALMSDLNRVDPVTIQRMKQVTPRRVIRALEVYRITGTPISQLHSESVTWPEFDAYQVGLSWDKAELHRRIDDRVDTMVASGLEAEISSLISRGYTSQLDALNTVGYKEVFDFMEGLRSREETIELIKRNTSRFAKRQLTWFKRDQRIHWISVSGDDWIRRTAEQVIRSFNEQEFGKL